MDDGAIRTKLAGRAQQAGRINALEAWEKTASQKDLKVFESYVRNWLLMRADGANIGWKSFAELCGEDIAGFNMGAQALKGALSGRIKRL